MKTNSQNKRMIQLIKSLSVAFFLLSSISSFAQLKSFDKMTCRGCLAIIQQFPKEMNLSFSLEENNELFLNISDPKAFLSLNKLNGVKLLASIIKKDDYACGKEPKDNVLYLPAVALSDVETSLIESVTKGGYGRIPMGELIESPKSRDDIEFNLVFIIGNTICQEKTFYSIRAYDFGLLDMGLFLDKPVFMDEFVSTDGRISRKVHFSIPFEYSSADFEEKSMQALIDSFQIDGYKIDTISLKAYSSVEGEVLFNQKLQKERGEAILKSLLPYSSSGVYQKIETKENWPEFYTAISKIDSIAFLLNVEKDSVKNYLKRKEFKAGLEPLLAKHRKVIVDLGLRIKESSDMLSDDKLIGDFEESLGSNKLKEAEELMLKLYYRCKFNVSDPSSFGSLQIPEQITDAAILGLKSVCAYDLGLKDLEESYLEAESLVKLNPKSLRLRYNYIALKLSMWNQYLIEKPKESFLREIVSLKALGLDPVLLDRLMINYNLIKAREHLQNKEYEEKDRCTRFVMSKFKSVNLKEADYLKIAQYLINYRADEVVNIARFVQDEAVKAESNEDLLFYFLNLAVFNWKILDKGVKLNAVTAATQRNRSRFCRMFNSNMTSGITIQLAEVGDLKSYYCDYCN